MIGSGYWLVDSGAGILLLDAERAARRLLERRLVTELQSGGLAMRPLLVPERLTVTPSRVELVERYRETLQQLGFDVVPGGPRSITVHGVPRIQTGPVAEALASLLALLADAPGSAQVVAGRWAAVLPIGGLGLDDPSRCRRRVAEWLAEYGTSAVAGIARPLHAGDLAGLLDRP